MNISWNDIKNSVNIAEYAVNKYNYKIDSKKSSINWVYLSNGKDDIIVTRSNVGHYLYRNIHNSSEQGSIVDFILNREPSYNNLKPVYNDLVKYIENPIINEEIFKTKTFDRNSFLEEYGKYYNSSFNNTKFLVDREISINTINHPIFKNKICSIPYFNKATNDNYLNTAFPIFNKDGLIGFDVRNNNFKGTVGSKTSGLWISNFDNTKDIDKLIITDSPIDALAHFQLYGQKSNDNILYVSSCGTLQKNQVERLNEIINNGLKNPLTNSIIKINSVVTGFDNKPTDQRFNTTFLSNFFTPKNNKFNCLNNIKINPVFIKSNSEQNITGANYMQFVFENSNKAENKILVSLLHEKVLLKNREFEKYNDNCLTFVIADKQIDDDKAVVNLEFTNNLANWIGANEIVKDLKFQNNKNISFEFASGKDFNDELKEKIQLLKNKEINFDKYLTLNNDSLKGQLVKFKKDENSFVYGRLVENVKDNKNVIKLENVYYFNNNEKKYNKVETFNTFKKNEVFKENVIEKQKNNSMKL